jgi:hypothetical protein
MSLDFSKVSYVRWPVPDTIRGEQDVGFVNISDEYQPARLYYGNEDGRLIPVRHEQDLALLQGDQQAINSGETLGVKDMLESYLPLDFTFKWTRDAMRYYQFPIARKPKPAFDMPTSMRPYYASLLDEEGEIDAKKRDAYLESLQKESRGYNASEAALKGKFDAKENQENNFLFKWDQKDSFPLDALAKEPTVGGIGLQNIYDRLQVHSTFYPNSLENPYTPIVTSILRESKLPAMIGFGGGLFMGLFYWYGLNLYQHHRLAWSLISGTALRFGKQSHSLFMEKCFAPEFSLSLQIIISSCY